MGRTVELEILRRVAASLEALCDFEVGPTAVRAERDVALGVLHRFDTSVYGPMGLWVCR